MPQGAQIPDRGSDPHHGFGRDCASTRQTFSHLYLLTSERNDSIVNQTLASLLTSQESLLGLMAWRFCLSFVAFVMQLFPAVGPAEVSPGGFAKIHPAVFASLAQGDEVSFGLWNVIMLCLAFRKPEQ
jgi:hypothetical protein